MAVSKDADHVYQCMCLTLLLIWAAWVLFSPITLSWYNNTMISFNMLEAARISVIKRFDSESL